MGTSTGDKWESTAKIDGNYWGSRLFPTLHGNQLGSVKTGFLPTNTRYVSGMPQRCKWLILIYIYIMGYGGFNQLFDGDSMGLYGTLVGYGWET